MPDDGPNSPQRRCSICGKSPAPPLLVKGRIYYLCDGPEGCRNMLLRAPGEYRKAWLAEYPEVARRLDRWPT